MRVSLIPIYPNGAYPDVPGLLPDLLRAARGLRDDLAALDVDAAGLSPYAIKYLNTYRSSLHGWLAWTVHLLAWGVGESGREPADITLVDHGGGIGFMSLLAKRAGFGGVVYTDFHAGMTADARTLGHLLGSPADNYLVGEIEACLDRVPMDTLHRLLVSNNVIEHVYDPFTMLRSLAALPAPNSVAIFTTANPRNPRVRRAHYRVHRMREYDGLPEDVARETKAGSTAGPFLDARRQRIAGLAPDIDPEDLETLARLTRGLWGTHIDKAARVFQRSGNLPEGPDHPTNTCDPSNGSWEERLVDPGLYLAALEEAGFRGDIVPGFYFGEGSAAKRRVVPVLNGVVRLLGSHGLTLAPYYGIVASRDLP